MEQKYIRLKAKLLFLFSFISVAIFSQTYIPTPFKNLPLVTTVDTTLDRLILLHWNGSKFVDNIIRPSTILRKAGGSGISGLIPGAVPYATSSTTLGNSRAFTNSFGFTIFSPDSNSYFTVIDNTIVASTPDGYFKVYTPYAKIQHNSTVIIDAPTINIPQGVANKILFLNGAKNVKPIYLGTGLTLTDSTLSGSSTIDTSYFGHIKTIANGFGILGGASTPTVTLKVDTTQKATNALTGFMSYADRQTFNNKVSSQWTTTGSDIYYNTGNVMIGTNAAPASTLHTVTTTTVTTRGIIADQYSSTGSSRVVMRAANGTFASPTTVAVNRILSNWVTQGHDGTNFIENGAIRTTAVGTIATTRVGTKMELMTGTDAAPTVLTTALTLDQNQNATFGGSVGLTGTRVSKGWFTDLEITNPPSVNGTAYASTSSLNTGSFGVTYDGQGGVVTTNNYTSVVIPYAGTITKWYISSIDPTAGTALSGSIVIDIKRSGTSIIGSGNKPTLTTASSANAVANGSWSSLTVAANDQLDFYIVSATTCQKVNCTIIITKQ